MNTINNSKSSKAITMPIIIHSVLLDCGDGDGVGVGNGVGAGIDVHCPLLHANPRGQSESALP